MTIEGSALVSDQRMPIYVFRDKRFARSECVVTAAPADLVVATYGGGGRKGEDGLQDVFGGSALFEDDASGACFLAVWGARKGARFRSRLAKGNVTLENVREPPPGRLKNRTTR